MMTGPVPIQWISKPARPGPMILHWDGEAWTTVTHPRAFPELSVATWSTHDTAPITQWWSDLHDWERERLARLDGIALDLPEAERELALFKLLFSSKSALTLFLAQELLGAKERINVPGTVNEQNWTWRLARPIEDLEADPALGQRFAAIRAHAEAFGRL